MGFLSGIASWFMKLFMAYIGQVVYDYVAKLIAEQKRKKAQEKAMDEYKKAFERGASKEELEQKEREYLNS
jgi:CBS domain containing-hemolysin-like protein